jgi:hypothetical protein
MKSYIGCTEKDISNGLSFMEKKEEMYDLITNKISKKRSRSFLLCSPLKGICETKN